MMNDLPAPPVPDDCELSGFNFMPLDIRRLTTSDLARSEDPAACWAALLLWCESWEQVPAASLPDDEVVLAASAGFGRDMKGWRKVREGAMRGWVKCNDGRLYHFVVAEKALEAWLEKLAQRRAGGNGNAKRWGLAFDVAAVDAAMAEARRLLAALNPQSRALSKRRTAEKVSREDRQTIAEGSSDDRHGDRGAIAEGSPDDRQTIARRSQGTGTGTGIRIDTRSRGVARAGAQPPPTPQDQDKLTRRLLVAGAAFVAQDLASWESLVDRHGEPAVVQAVAALLADGETPRSNAIEPWITEQETRAARDADARQRALRQAAEAAQDQADAAKRAEADRAAAQQSAAVAAWLDDHPDEEARLPRHLAPVRAAARAGRLTAMGLEALRLNLGGLESIQIKKCESTLPGTCCAENNALKVNPEAEAKGLGNLRRMVLTGHSDRPGTP